MCDEVFTTYEQFRERYYPNDFKQDNPPSDPCKFAEWLSKRLIRKFEAILTEEGK